MAVSILALLGTIGAGVASAAGAVGGAVAGAAGAVAGAAGGIAGGLAGAAGTVGSALGSAAGAVGSGLGAAGSAIGGAASGIGSALGSAGGAIGSGLSSAVTGIGQAAGTVGNALGGAAQGIGTGLQSVGQGLSGAAQSAVQGVGQIAGQAGQGISQAAQSVGQGLSNAAQGVGQGLQNVGQGVQNIGGQALEGLQNVGGQAVDAVQSAGSTVKDLGGQAVDALQSGATNLMGGGQEEQPSSTRGSYLRELDAERAAQPGQGLIGTVGSYLKDNTTAGRMYTALSEPDSFQGSPTAANASGSKQAGDYSSVGQRLLSAYLGPESETLTSGQRYMGLAQGIFGGLKGGYAGWHGQMGGPDAFSTARDYTQRTVAAGYEKAWKDDMKATLDDPNATDEEKDVARYALATGRMPKPARSREPARDRLPYLETEYDKETDTETQYRVYPDEGGRRVQVGDARPANRVKAPKGTSPSKPTAKQIATNGEIDQDRGWWDGLDEDEKREALRRAEFEPETQARLKNLSKSKVGEGGDPRRNEILNEFADLRKRKAKAEEEEEGIGWLDRAIGGASAYGSRWFGRQGAQATPAPPPTPKKGDHYRQGKTTWVWE